MKKIIESIVSMNAVDLQEIMEAIEQRLSVIYPEWDFLYIALPKDPKLRQQEVANILKFMHSAEG